MIGKKFGKLTVLAKCEDSKYKYKCRCDCGTIKCISKYKLLNGSTKSCGCSRGVRHGKHDSRLYTIYYKMKTRCYNQHYNGYKNYGARGITICDEWLSDFMTFYDWAINNGYRDYLTIDRIDNDGNYEPSNCRWVTMHEQNRNKRDTKMCTINGETHCLTDWCKILNLDRNTVSARINKLGWPIEEALEVR